MLEMTQALQSPFGKICVAPLPQLFEHLAQAINQAAQAAHAPKAIGMSGGSTPKAFYEWALNEQVLVNPEKLFWTTSDERHVPIDHPDSNFGALKRLLLDPLGIPQHQHMPWAVELSPNENALAFENDWHNHFGAEAFEICVLGVGDDGHTASLFPHCRLLQTCPSRFFEAVEWPGKGWRLTSTEMAFAHSKRLIVLGTGRGKAKTLQAIFEGPLDVPNYPVQCLKPFAHKTTWLMDPDAASLLKAEAFA
jgi:6-phosphogluconolactonase